MRDAAARGEPVPEGLEAWIAKVRERAYTATDADVDALRAAGYSEDLIFEATVAAAVGAGLVRFDAGLRALR